MNVSLTPELEELVKRKVRSGLYTTASEVIREALRLLEEKERLREMHLEELREDIRKGLDRGGARTFDEDLAAEIKSKGRKTLVRQTGGKGA